MLNGVKEFLEGRWYATPTEVGQGLLGATERQFKHINGGVRGMGVTEQWVVRAIVRALLEVAGGTETDGRFSLDLSSGDSTGAERLDAVEQDVGGLKMILTELRALVPEPESVQSILDIQESLAARLEALEQVAKTEDQIRPLYEDIAALSKRIEALEQTATTPTLQAGASVPEATSQRPQPRGRATKTESAAPANSKGSNEGDW